MREKNGNGEKEYRREGIKNNLLEGKRDGEREEILLGFEDNNPVKTGVIFDKSEWLTTIEAAVYLRKFEPSGSPSVNAIHKMVARGSVRRRKFSGRLFFRKKELDFLIESSAT